MMRAHYKKAAAALALAVALAAGVAGVAQSAANVGNSLRSHASVAKFGNSL